MTAFLPTAAGLTPDLVLGPLWQLRPWCALEAVVLGAFCAEVRERRRPPRREGVRRRLTKQLFSRFEGFAQPLAEQVRTISEIIAHLLEFFQLFAQLVVNRVRGVLGIYRLLCMSEYVDHRHDAVLNRNKCSHCIVIEVASLCVGPLEHSKHLDSYF